VRAFLAVPADEAWVESACELVAGLRSRLPRASWTKPETWHVTVRFLGEISENAAAAFAARVGNAAESLHGGVLAPGGPIAFPPRGPARVLGVGFAAPPAGDPLALAALAAEEAARAIGCSPDAKPFRPHVTLARLRDPWACAAVESFQDAVRAWSFPVWRIRGLVLYRSRLDPAGAVHAPVREWAAARADAGARA
jgi:2'-5' RNA ligase